MLERLPTPWGLVRSGVAPDHPKIKSVTRIYEKTAAHPRFRYFGNVEFGRDVSREDLLEHYHAIIYATGSLSIARWASTVKISPARTPPRSSSAGTTATPITRDLEVDLQSPECAVVIGNGNVAVDVARMLCLTREELAQTDIADHALEVLEHSRVSEIVIVGRRGPPRPRLRPPSCSSWASFRCRCDRRSRRSSSGRSPFPTPPPAPPPNGMSRCCASTPRDPPPAGAGGSCSASSTRPSRSPRAQTVDWEVSSSSATSSSPLTTAGWRPSRRARASRSPPGLSSARSATAGVPLPGVPFDERSGVIPNADGRVLDPASGAPLPGEYVVGWIKRGPPA